MSKLSNNLPARFGGRVAVLACFLMAVAVSPAITKAADPPAASLALVPQDAAYYTAMLRLGEQIDIVAQSNWWKRVNEWDLVQQMKFMLQFGLQQQGGPGPQFQQWIAQPENQQLLEVLRDMASDEVFCYGDAQTTQTMALVMEAVNTLQYGSMMYQIAGGDTDLSEEEYMAKMILDTLADEAENVAVPTMVLGFKISNVDPAEEQLRRLEAYARVIVEQVPELAEVKDKFKRTKIAGSEFLTLDLDGSLIPWDEIPFADLEEEAGQYDALQKKLRGMTLSIAIGVHKGYALFSVGTSNDHLAKLGEGDSLADHPKLAALRAKGSERMTSIGYVSEQFMQSVATKPGDLDEMVEMVGQLLPAAELPAADEKQIMGDVAELAKDVKPFIPAMGTQLTFSYMTDRGIESFAYNWNENIALDGSKTLPLIDHLGGNPIFAFLGRAQHRPQDYELLVKWLKKGRGYLEKYGVPEMSDSERANYDRFASIAYPILERIDEVNRTKLIPAIADGQTAIVIDGSLKTNQWMERMPPTTEEIALPSPAIVLGLKDPDLFKQALSDYRSIVNDVIQEMHKANPDEVPDFQLPAAKVRVLNNGAEVYYYPLPAELGVYDRVAPNVAVADTFSVLSLAPRHTVSIVKKQGLDVDGGPLADTSRPLAAATYFDWAGMVDMMHPWVNEGVRAYVSSMEDAFGALEAEGALRAQDDSDMAKQILDQVKQGAEFLKVMRGYSSVTYMEDGATVTHGETRFKDID